MEKVGVNNFVKRQIKGSGKTYAYNLTFEEIALDAQNQMSKGEFKEGYRQGVRIVNASRSNIKSFYCPFVKIDENTQLVSRIVSRQSGEQPYIQTRAISGTPLASESIHAVPKGIEKMPMGPVTMMRNQLELEGGTKAKYTSEEWAESIYFWQKYAALDC